MRRARAVLVVGSALLFGCASGEVEGGWRLEQEHPEAPRLVIERAIEVGGSGVSLSMPAEPTRIARLEADARDFPLGTTLWATITNAQTSGGKTRNLLLSGVFGHQALVGTYPGNANWVAHDTQFAPREEITITLRAVEWDQTQMIFGGQSHGEASAGAVVSGYPYNRVIKLAQPHTKVRLTVVPDAQ